MKKLVGLIFILLVFYSIYNDFHRGSLPAAVTEESITETPVKQEEAVTEAKTLYFEKEILPGDTVISILENQLNKAIPVPISQVVEDFELLNNGIKPEEIKFGKSYKFPDYQSIE